LRGTPKKLTWHECDKFVVLMEPDVVEPKPQVGRGAEDSHPAGYQSGLLGRPDTRILVDRTLMP
jgi:hypothetical protein